MAHTVLCRAQEHLCTPKYHSGRTCCTMGWGLESRGRTHCICRALRRGNTGLAPSGRNYQKSCLSAASTLRKGCDFTPQASPRIKTRQARRFITHKPRRITNAAWKETCLRERSLTGMQEQSSLAKITLEHGKWSRSLAGLNNGISKCLV